MKILRSVVLALVAVACAKAPPPGSIAYDENAVRDRDIEFYEARVAQDPSSALDRAALARLLFARSRTTDSKADLDRAEQLVRQSVTERTRRNYGSLNLLSSLLMDRHQFADAREIALRADSLDPGVPSHLALLGEIELELGEYEAAAARFNAINYDRRNFTVGARLARWYEVTGKADRARALLKQTILDVDRRDDLPREQVAWFHYRLGDLELRLGNLDSAESAFKAALVRHPDDDRPLGGLARVSLIRGDWESAIEYGKRATVTHKDVSHLRTMSLAYAKLGNAAEAATYAKAMSMSAVNEPGAIQREWGLFLLDNGTAQDRADVLRKATEELQGRKDVYAHDLMAWALYRNGRIKEARKFMKVALSQGTQDVMLRDHAKAMGLLVSS